MPSSLVALGEEWARMVIWDLAKRRGPSRASNKLRHDSLPQILLTQLTPSPGMQFAWIACFADREPLITRRN
jgi:hypothetical protein